MHPTKPRYILWYTSVCIYIYIDVYNKGSTVSNCWSYRYKLPTHPENKQTKSHIMSVLFYAWFKFTFDILCWLEKKKKLLMTHVNMYIQTSKQNFYRRAQQTTSRACIVGTLNFHDSIDIRAQHILTIQNNHFQWLILLYCFSMLNLKVLFFIQTIWCTYWGCWDCDNEPLFNTNFWYFIVWLDTAIFLT